VDAFDDVVDHRGRVVGMLVAIDVDLGALDVGIDDHRAELRLPDTERRRQDLLRVVGHVDPLRQRLEPVLLDLDEVASRGRRHHEWALDDADRLAIDRYARADQVLVGVGADLELRLLRERHEQLLRLADARDLERTRRRLVAGRFDRHREVARVERAFIRRHTDGGAVLAVDVDRCALRRGVDLDLELAGLDRRAVRGVRALRRAHE
jgi:hypothetical protein